MNRDIFIRHAVHLAAKKLKAIAERDRDMGFEDVIEASAIAGKLFLDCAKSAESLAPKEVAEFGVVSER